MLGEKLTKEAMTLPLAERVALAQSLWQSIGDALPGNTDDEVRWAVEEADRRDEELHSGKASGRTHEQVMRAARRAIE